jgi:hypothetical protein
MGYSNQGHPLDDGWWGSTHRSPAVARWSKTRRHGGLHRSSPILGYGTSNLTGFDPMGRHGTVNHSKVSGGRGDRSLVHDGGAFIHVVSDDDRELQGMEQAGTGSNG